MRLKSKIFKCSLLLVFSGLAAAVHAGPKPNILFIAIDDMNDWVGFLGGHPQAITPNMDRLAKKGVNFTNAHCSAPGCSPSRNSLLFGVEPFRSGLYGFYDPDQFSPEVLKNYTSLPTFLKQNGYNTFGSGKIHHKLSPTPQEWTEFFDKGKAENIVFDTETGYRQGKDWKMNFSPTLNPFENHTDHKNASYGIDVLSRKHDKPFFLAVGIIKPHLPFICPKPFFDRYPDPVDPPRIHPDDLSDIPAVGRSMVKIKDYKRFNKDQAWDKVRRAYLACISWADFNVGRVLDALAASPYADNTIIVLWSDHGYALGEKNHFRKFALWEETTRVPFIILDPRQKNAPEGRTVTGGVSLINIYRTLAELTGLEAPEYVDGFSLVPQLKDPARPMPDPAICSWGRGNYTLRDTQWRYTRYYNGTEELYDHNNDADEWTNLAENPEYSDVKKRLAAAIPDDEVALVEDSLEAWSLPASADKPLDKKKK